MPLATRCPYSEGRVSILFECSKYCRKELPGPSYVSLLNNSH